MSKFDRKKIAITLAFASLFGNKTSATNSNINTKSTNKSGFSTDQIKNSKSGAEIPKPLGTLNIRNDSSGNGIFNWVKNHKAVSIAAPLLIVGAVGLTIWGVKHKSKDNQNPDEQNPDEQNPGGPKSNEQDPNKKKDNEQKPPIDNSVPKVNNNSAGSQPGAQTQPVVQTKPMQNIITGQQNNLHPAPQQIQQQQYDLTTVWQARQQLLQQVQQQSFEGYVATASRSVGQQNADNFAKAVFAFNEEHPDGKLSGGFITRVLACLEAGFPTSLRDVENFGYLAGLKQQQGVGFEFFKDQRAAVHCCVYIGDLVYDFCFYGDDDSNVFMKCCRRGNNSNWPVVEQIKIENNVVSVVKQ